MAINEIEVALSKMVKNYTIADTTPKVVEPVILAKDEKVNKSLVTKIVIDYKGAILACQDFENFNKLLNAMAGSLNLNLNDDIVTLAKISNSIRSKYGLDIL